MTPYEELLALAEKLNEAANGLDRDDVAKPLRDLEKAAQKVGLSFSGSWLGYHSRVYYSGFQPPPPGDHFSQELWPYDYLSESSENWKEYDAEVVKAHIQSLAKNPALYVAQSTAKDALKTFKFSQLDIISIL